MSNPRWNGEPCTARRITAIVADNQAFPAYWARSYVGTRRNIVEVEYAGSTFYLDDEAGEGWHKVTHGGSPRFAHSNITIDPDSIEPREPAADRLTTDTITTDQLAALYDERDQLKAWLERGFDEHMAFGLIRPDGTDEQLPCADWCYACRIEKANAAVAELAQAIRLTREYVGEELLPAVEGWSWYDALRRHAPHELAGQPSTEAAEWRAADHAGHGSPCERTPDGSCAAPATAAAADPEDEWTGSLIPPDLAEAIRAEDAKDAATTLRTLISEAMRAHQLSDNRDEADADGNAPCVCGNWREPGPMGSDDDDWDNHMADVALDVILPTTRLLGALYRSAHEDVQRVIALYERWKKADGPPLRTSQFLRWWPERLDELHDAILPPDDQTEETSMDQEQGAPVDWQAIAEQRERELKTVGEQKHAVEQERDGAYRERARLVALLAAMTDNAVIVPALDLDEPGWWIAYLTIGGRQASWHVSPQDAGLFIHVEHVDMDDPRAQWDGHTTEEKYAGIAAWTAELAQRCGPACSEGHTYTGRCESARKS